MNNDKINFIFSNNEKNFNPRNPWVIKNKKKIISLLYRKDIEIAVYATPALLRLIIQNQHPAVVKLLDFFKVPWLQGHGLIIAKRQIIKLINGKSSENSEFIFSLCDIRVVSKELNQFNLMDAAVKNEIILDKPDLQLKKI